MLKLLRFDSPNLTVTFSDGKIIQVNTTLEKVQELLDYAKLEDLTFEKVSEFFDPEWTENISKIKEVENIYSNTPYTLKNNCLYYKGIDLSIPSHLAEDIVVAYQKEDKEEIEKLTNFWKWVSLIQQPESRESFYSYTRVNKGIITKEGLYIAFRRVMTNKVKDEIDQLYKTLRGRKKSTNVEVYVEKGQINTKGGFHLGNLKSLYPAKSFHSRTTGQNGLPTYFEIGEETRLGVNEVDWSNAECSRGLHCSNGGYDFVGYGDVSIAVVINPMDVVFCPYQDQSKMRVMAMTPIAILENDCEFELTDQVQEYISSIYEKHVNRLNDLLDSSEFTELNRNLFLQESQIIQSLNVIVSDNKSIVKDRLKKL